ncbi:NHLP-related RiPP peptide [Oxalobacteraceae bacterium A2-2]
MATHAPHAIDTLLDKLAGDDVFRAQLVDRPQQALDSIGIQVEAERIPAVRCLPAKEVIAANRAALRGKLDNVAAAFPFFLGDK